LRSTLSHLSHRPAGGTEEGFAGLKVDVESGTAAFHTVRLGTAKKSFV